MKPVHLNKIMTDPDMVGSSEYLALYELLTTVIESRRSEGDPVTVADLDGIIEELEHHCAQARAELAGFKPAREVVLNSED